MSIPDLAPPTPPAEPTAEQKEFRRRMLLMKRAKDGVNWFYWIALLSTINTIIFVAGSQPNFFLGLGIVQLVNDYTASAANGAQIAPLMRWVAGAIDLLLGGIFVFFGYRGQRSYRNWIVAGIILYALDGMIFVAFSVWIGVIIHAFIIYNLVRGLRAMDQLKHIGPAREPAGNQPA